MKKKPIVAGNWKMNILPSRSKLFISKITKLVNNIKATEVIIAPPFTGLDSIKLSPPFYSCAQNCHWDESGALTGEVSIAMIKDCGAKYVIVGHSERRKIFGETDQWINNKVKSIIANGLNPILCIGETIDERETGDTENILSQQLQLGLDSVSNLKNCIIAYEPVWAIGTGLTATIDQVETAHKFIRSFISKKYKSGNDINILYGGSVNSDNAESLIKTNGVDGFLIGGASLDAESFASIIKIVDNSQEIRL